ncbi:hypothetical protein E2562_031398 [Oryza meyeriana var. granulata]|uniref:Uncharacterized protein n=1 Tax=Oryza meyeriana var. granulata TaxID=110450 RepID=A0A6G1C1H3_9ORYZ|nr:hypothetical protein E2562_031398 [Oryza meyeriana var. granulata]
MDIKILDGTPWELLVMKSKSQKEGTEADESEEEGERKKALVSDDLLQASIVRLASIETPVDTQLRINVVPNFG